MIIWAPIGLGEVLRGNVRTSAKGNLGYYFKHNKP
jgi:hypothetical protein